MPRIFDNIAQQLLPTLRETLEVANRADFCVGYFNLRGWKQLDSYIERWPVGEGHCCRLLVGMQRLPQEELRGAMSLIKRDGGIDNQTALRLKRKLAEEFRDQLTVGVPTNADEAGLRRLAAQIKAGKVVVRLFLRHPLHAKLYLLFRPDPINPIVGYLGSSNLTLAGLSQQGELNVDVLDHDACRKLAGWFEDRWNDRWCLDISDELVRTIEESWAREERIPPYHIYVKMAYHLSQEARAGLSEFRIPRDFGQKLFEFQTAAVKIAAHHLNKRGGVLIGDVVGLGKTLMATALARIFEDDYGLETLILCPKNLVKMWESYREQYRLRTRSFIQDNYAETDLAGGRRFLTFEDGTRSYFPARLPKTVKFEIDETDPQDQYARLYAPEVVDLINALNLPRYGLGNYPAPSPHEPPTPAEARALQDLSRAGKRLMGFCRTNLFKRLESSGQAFLQSVERHILRNYVFLHAIDQGRPLPIGAQDAGMLDARVYDEDAEAVDVTAELFEEDNDAADAVAKTLPLRTEDDFNGRSPAPSLLQAHSGEEGLPGGFEASLQGRAAEAYADYTGQYKSRFRWLRPTLFDKTLAEDLRSDTQALLRILRSCGEWDAGRDAKLNALLDLLTEKHPNEKVLVFTQFADTVRYLEAQLKARGLSKLAGATGDSPDPTALAWRFSPESNGRRGQIPPEEELRVLVATDVLSEGQNLQDGFIVVNYDLPWAIVRLVQRAGRVDRIGQQAEEIRCYSFLPADGVERIIRLREHVRQRLHENAEVVGTDEAFFEDDRNDQTVLDLYHEKSGILDGEADTEVDLASYAYQIWKNAITVDPSLRKSIPELPPVVYSTRAYQPGDQHPPLPPCARGGKGGVLVYLRTAEGNDTLAWIDQDGRSVTESQLAILKAAECPPKTPALPRLEDHHALVQRGVELIVEEEKSAGGQLGRPSGARFRTYERLKRYAEEVKGTLFAPQELLKAIDEIYRYPLRPSAVDTLNRQLRSGISDETLAQLVIALRDEDRLCLVHEEEQAQEPRILCSMGLSAIGEGK